LKLHQYDILKPIKAVELVKYSSSLGTELSQWLTKLLPIYWKLQIRPVTRHFLKISWNSSIKICSFLVWQNCLYLHFY